MKRPGKSSKAFSAGGLVVLLVFAFAGHAFGQKKPKFAYVANDGSGNVSAYTIDSTTGALASVTAPAAQIGPTVIDNISVGLSPQGVGVNPTTNRVYVANGSDNTVSVIDGATNSVSATITVGSQPVGIGVNPATNRVYVSNYASNTLSVIDETVDVVIATIPGFSAPTGVAVNPVTNRIYVASYIIQGPVQVIDGATNSVIATLTPGGYYDNRGLGVGVNPTTNFVYAAYRAGDGSGGAFVSINGATNSVAADLFLCCLGAPHWVGVNPFTDRVYVSLPGWCCDPSTARWVSVIAAREETPAQQITDLVNTVNSFNLQAGIANSLDAKLQAALASLAANNVTSACNQISAFISEVMAQSGTNLTVAQANQLIAQANAIKTALGCP